MIQIYRSEAEKVIAAEPTNGCHRFFPNPKSQQSDTVEKGKTFRRKNKNKASQQRP